MKTYLQELKTRFSKYRATWVPDKQVRIGWVGTLEDNVFTLRTTLDDEGIPYRVVEDESEADWDYQSEGGSTITAKLAGEASPPGSQLGQADAGFSIQFNREKATVLKLGKVKVHQILNLAA
ncbi:MAG: hypothetical protein R3301_08805, partial [Saprospiraceae bacterium]|nr:hypothetical protein [Saprospiraceae bacterium]